MTYGGGAAASGCSQSGHQVADIVDVRGEAISRLGAEHQHQERQGHRSTRCRSRDEPAR